MIPVIKYTYRDLNRFVRVVDDLLGKRFEWTTGDYPDMTFVAFRREPSPAWRIHGRDGSRAWLPAAVVEAWFEAGSIIESERAPFVL